MREIKFRAWYKQEKKMYPVRGTLYQIIYLRKDKQDAALETLSGVQERDVELMQYTGLKDKNGTEIYEGDIVRFEIDDPKWDRIGAISYSFAEFTITSLARKYPDVRLSDATRVEVIGNIYQHPEYPGKE